VRAAVFGASGGIGAALVQVLAERGADVLAGSRTAAVLDHPRVTRFAFDLEDAPSIAAAAATMAGDPPELIIIASGVLSLPGGIAPERSYRAIDGEAMAAMFRINTIGPALIARHFLPLMPRTRRCVFAAISARVGSIGDNRLGGWHAYRASKAALNMLMRNFAIEMARTHPLAVIAGLHPGTVATPLSRPFAGNLPAGQLTEPRDAASRLLSVLDGLGPQDSGGVFDWRGDRVPD